MTNQTSTGSKMYETVTRKLQCHAFKRIYVTLHTYTSLTLSVADDFLKRRKLSKKEGEDDPIGDYEIKKNVFIEILSMKKIS